MPSDNLYATRRSQGLPSAAKDLRSPDNPSLGAVYDEEAHDGFDLNKELICNKPATFFMRVNSDAMRESGIYKEDVVVVDRSLKAVTGKVIIAMLNGEMLIRRFEKNNTRIRLLADAGRLAPIPIDACCEGFSVWGVVTYVIHKL